MVTGHSLAYVSAEPEKARVRLRSPSEIPAHSAGRVDSQSSPTRGLARTLRHVTDRPDEELWLPRSEQCGLQFYVPNTALRLERGDLNVQLWWRQLARRCRSRMLAPIYRLYEHRLVRQVQAFPVPPKKRLSQQTGQPERTCHAK